MITIDPNAPEAPYEQVREQIRTQVAAGELAPGTKLPTVRAWPATWASRPTPWPGPTGSSRRSA